MSIKINSKDISEKFGKLKAVLKSRTGEPSGILVKGNTLYAGSFELAIRTKLDMQNEETFVIPKSAVEFIENLPDGTAEISQKGNSVLIKCGGVKGKYQTVPADEFPEMKTKVSTENPIYIDGEELRKALNSVLYAADETSVREMLRGVLLDAKDGYLNLVGCDGYRLAWNRIEYDGEFKVIIPKTAVKQILSIESDGDASLSWNNSFISVMSADYEIITRILSGEYMDYTKLAPEHKNHVELNRKKVIDCVKRALICADNQKKLKLKFEGKSLTVIAGQNVSESEETINLQSGTDKPLTIGFNGKYLLDMFGSFNEDTLKVGIGTEKQPVTVESGNLRAMALPVRLG